MWKLCVVDDESNRTMVKLVRADYTIGRAEDSTIRLTERNISRSHARLYRENGAWMLEDRQSFTGSFINGERINGSQSLKHGDMIQLGDYRLDLSDEEAEQAASEAPAAEARAAAAALPDRFIVMQGPDVGAVFALTEQKLLVGRGEECQIPLDDASVSRVHLEVMRTEHGLMVLDQGSSNGLRINGTDLPSAMLRSGDLLELGDVRLKFVPAGVDDAGTPFSDPSAVVAEAAPPRLSVRSGTSRSTFGVMLFGLGVLALGVALFMAFRPRSDEEAPVAANAAGAGDTPAPAAGEGGNALIAEAKALADQGAVVMAHRKLSELPADSALRQSEEFKDIERRWADEIFRAAEVSPDPAERKRLLERIARTTALDTERRRRAADALAKLEAEDVEAVQVSDLPNSDPKGRAKIVAAKQRVKKPMPRPSRPTGGALGGAAGEAAGDPGAEREAPATASANAEPAEPSPSQKPAETPAPKANKPAAQKEAKEGPELIRETPF